MNPGRKILKSRPGFTLLELIAVLVIGAILIAAVSAGAASTMQGVAVTTGADLISNIFSEAHADAVAKNLNVEVRIYNLAPGSGGAPYYRALQFFALNADGTTRALTKMQYLPDGAAIDATTTHSTLIASNTKTTAPDPGDPHLDTNTRVFHFLPGGGTDLDPATNWFLTVRAAAQSDATRFPANWASVRIDPITGHAQIYRP